MSRRSIATPCPITGAPQHSFSKNFDETTTTLNFTTAFDASFRNVKPKRQSRLSVQFAIHEDQGMTQNKDKPQFAGLTKPARRLTGSFGQLQTTTAPNDESKRTTQPRRESGLSLIQAPKRPPHRLSIVPESARKEAELEQVQEEDARSLGLTIHAARPMRRRTIYIPNDDTTIPSMYMGIFSPLKYLEPSNKDMSDAAPDVSGLAAQMAIKRGRGRRTSMIDAAPRRAPLQLSNKNIQPTTLPHDIPGQNGGKENMPPGLSECEKQMPELNLVEAGSVVPSRSRLSQTHQIDRRKSIQTSIYAPTTSSSAQTKARKSFSIKSNLSQVPDEMSKPWGATPTTSDPNKSSIMQRNTLRPVNESAPGPVRPKPRVPSRFVVPKIHHVRAITENPVLTSNIENPALYEDNWLGHQEIAITQLLNKLFTATQPRSDLDCLSNSLTQELLVVYDKSGVAVLHNRIEAAMLYGALSIPQDVLDQGEGLVRDVGRKQRFIELWIGTYDRDALEAGLEVVVGRQCRTHTARKSDGHCPAQSPTRKALNTFVDAFLLRNEDVRPDRTVRKRAAWSYQRTFLRSLMLIKILDTIKTSKSTSFCRPLFRSTSSFKSSTAVLHTLFQMMNPAAGDPVRALGHINYNVSHVQYPLEEFQYNIDNLAIDLRDGVRLTRLIELLLYPSASHALDKTTDSDATTTIVMPAGEAVGFTNGQDWPLSQHLKYPCPSRVARVWNVQIALSAAARVKGMESLVDGISAEDIVDGFREKTIRLLWALVGKCGLASLINWTDVAWETRRLKLRTTTPSVYNDDDLHDTDSSNRTFESCKNQLKNWVRAVAASKALQIHNFTTSLADGKIFEAIVDTYEPYLHSSMSTTRREALSTRLTRLGCSKQFAELFNPNELHVFDRDFVLATLAFLCSRLLAPTRSARAASVIQSAWRAYWAKVETKRNQTRKIIADACAEFVSLKVSSHVEVGGNELELELEHEHEHEHEDQVQQRLNYCVLQSPVSEAGDIWLSL